jgi:hypothetical protein
VANQDAAGGQHLLDYAQAEREPEIQPDGMADHFSREAVAGIVRMTGRVHEREYASIPSPLHEPDDAFLMLNLWAPHA